VLPNKPLQRTALRAAAERRGVRPRSQLLSPRIGGRLFQFRHAVWGRLGIAGLSFPPMSPTVLRSRGYRFYFFSREETRPHVHVQHATGEAKFWLDPELSVANNYGLTAQRLSIARRIAREHQDEIRKAWDAHFGR